MTIYEQVEGIIKDATATLNEKLACQKITDSIDISNYTMDLKVAMATILRLGLFEKDSCNLLFPNYRSVY